MNEAYEANSKCFQPGLKPNQVITQYDTWSSSYDKMMVRGTYNGPAMALEEVQTLVPAPQRPGCRVLDVGAGTGLVGALLAQAGFSLLDAVEPSSGMLEILKEKKIYQKIYNVYLGSGETNGLPTDMYDLLVTVGVMGDNHLPLKSVDDLIKVTKPGGLVVVVMRKENTEKTEEYKDKFEPYLQGLEERGLWTQITRKVMPNYFCDKEGLILTYRVM